MHFEIKNVFSTSNHENTAEGGNFYSYRYHANEAPMVMLNLRFMLNNYKQQRRERNGDDMNGDEGEEDF